MLKRIELKGNSTYILGAKGSTIKEISKTICEAYNDNKKSSILIFGKQNVINAHANYLNILFN